MVLNPSIQPVSRKHGRGGVDTGDAGTPVPKTKSRSRFESVYEKKMTEVEEINFMKIFVVINLSLGNFELGLT